jgi:hypothetical protein
MTMRRFLPWNFYRTLKVGHRLLQVDHNIGLELWAKTIALAFGFKVRCYPKRMRRDVKLVERVMRGPPDGEKIGEVKDEEGQTILEEGLDHGR